jgi:hypothetical protein
MPHHLENIPEKVGRMRILFGIAVSVMLTVHDGISPRVQE